MSETNATFASPEPKTTAEAEVKALLESTPENLHELRQNLECMDMIESPRPEAVKSGETLFGIKPTEEKIEKKEEQEEPEKRTSEGKESTTSGTSDTKAPKKVARLPRVALLAQGKKKEGEAPKPKDTTAKPKPKKTTPPLAKKRPLDEGKDKSTEEPKPKTQKTLHNVPSRFMQATSKAIAQNREIVAQRKKELEETKQTPRGAATGGATKRKTPPAVSAPTAMTKAFKSVQSKVNTHNHPAVKKQCTTQTKHPKGKVTTRPSTEKKTEKEISSSQTSQTESQQDSQQEAPQQQGDETMGMRVHSSIDREPMVMETQLEMKEIVTHMPQPSPLKEVDMEMEVDTESKPEIVTAAPQEEPVAMEVEQEVVPTAEPPKPAEVESEEIPEAVAEEMNTATIIEPTTSEGEEAKESAVVADNGSSSFVDIVGSPVSPSRAPKETTSAALQSPTQVA